jgi:hypothetical protein
MLITLLLTPLALAAINSTDPFTKITQTIEQILTSIDNFLQHLKDVLKTHISSMSKTLSVILGLVGAFLYFSGLNKYTGRGMIIGAVLLYLLAEFILNI